MTTITHSSIALHALELSVHLGWPDAERLRAQTVRLDVNIHFQESPIACITDNIADTYCYDALITTIKEKIQAQEFRLLEHLGYKIYHIIKQALSEEATINIRINKQPAIPDLTGGVTFYYGDKPHLW